MIVTHTVTAAGLRRIYLSHSGSAEFYIDPLEHGAWRFHAERIFGGQPLSDADLQTCAAYTLARLCDRLEISPADLQTMPFDAIAALHDVDPSAGRRQPQGRRRAAENGYFAAAPNVRAVRPAPTDTSSKQRHR